MSGNPDDFVSPKFRSVARRFKSWMASLRPNKCNFVSPTTGDMLQKCKSWLATCAASHASCAIPIPKQPPSRLLPIVGSTIHICHTNELDVFPQYATLSHCWGRHAFLTLNKNNLEDFRKAIPLEALSITFKDVIFIAKYLDIKYIWIDSLCIVQDDDQDWPTESALMSDVYGCSYIYIAASGA